MNKHVYYDFLKQNKKQKIIHWLYKLSRYTKLPHLPLRGKVGQLSKRKSMLCWSIYIMSLWRILKVCIFWAGHSPQSTTEYLKFELNLFCMFFFIFVHVCNSMVEWKSTFLQISKMGIYIYVCLDVNQL